MVRRLEFRGKTILPAPPVYGEQTRSKLGSHLAVFGTRLRDTPRLAPALPICSVIVLLFTTASILLGAQNSSPTEYRSKAAFLATFPEFIEWPKDAFPSAQSSLSVCVRGDFSFGTSLAETTRGATPHGRRIEVRWVHKDQDLRRCHIAFVSRSESKRYPALLQAIAGAPVLTVGETPDFLDAGGAMGFTFQGGALHFEVNLAAATTAQLKISSRLLALALRVLNAREAAKG